MLQCPNRLRYVILDVLVAPCRENNNFVFFKVQHLNRGWTKYSNNNNPFFIWHLECNERRRINNMILNFFAPKLRVETTHRSRSDFTWLDWSAAAAFKTFSRPVSKLKERKKLFFPLFFLGSLTGSTVNVDLVNADWWPCKGPRADSAAQEGALGSPSRTKAYKSPILPHFDLISLLPLTSHFKKNL